jgi:hypothetical protein
MPNSEPTIQHERAGQYCSMDCRVWDQKHALGFDGKSRIKVCPMLQPAGGALSCGHPPCCCDRAWCTLTGPLLLHPHMLSAGPHLNNNKRHAWAFKVACW